ncbi:hypothetical protein ALP65_03120, partial [Pseudomonas aeruginosa]
DEIESMSLDVQVKLLRLLQERVVERLGSNQLIPLDIRIIAATKEDLRRPPTRAASAPTSITASTSPACAFHRCASAAKTSRCCSAISPKPAPCVMA